MDTFLLSLRSHGGDAAELAETALRAADEFDRGSAIERLYAVLLEDPESALTAVAAYTGDDRAALCAAAAAHEKTLRDRPVEAHVVSYGDSSIQYVLRFWTRTEDYWTCYNDVLDGMQAVFDAAGLTMTYPHINVHMGS